MTSPEQNHVEVFRQETIELLSEVQECLLIVENSPGNLDAIHRLFRAMHSIKGAGGMFGFDRITNFTHHVETALDQVREGKVPFSRGLIDLILASHDCIREMLDDENSVAESTLAAIENGLQELTGKRRFLATPTPPQPSTAPKRAVYHIRFKPAPTILRNGSEPIALLEELAKLGEMTTTCHIANLPYPAELNTELCYLYWDIVLTTERSRNEIEDVFIFVVADSQLDINMIDDGHDETQVPKLGEILVNRGDLTPAELHETLSEVDPIGNRLVKKSLVNVQQVESALAEQQALQSKRNSRQHEAASNTLRVSATKLDRLVDLVGELVTAQARISRIAAAPDAPKELSAVAEELENLTSGLRDEAMGLRMVPIGSILGSFRRLSRDLSRELGKDLQFTTLGEDTEMDKAVVERLKDPLIHILRNSIDHGIEKPLDRIAAGKSSVGSIHLEAMHVGAHVHIRITDDGKGIDLEAIRRKAIEKGILAPDTLRTADELHKLIFAPGFSTAERVTEVSGRGVGMDVVHQNIEALRGSIAIDSQPGKGTRITIKLPLTLAIIDGLMVTLDDDHFIMPLTTVEECLNLDHEELDKIKGRNIINLRGCAVPFVRLRDRLERKTQPPAREQVVIANLDGHRFGVVVDSVIGSYQTVLKSLGPVMRKAKSISGATIMGDGSVALILDLQGIQ